MAIKEMEKLVLTLDTPIKRQNQAEDLYKALQKCISMYKSLEKDTERYIDDLRYDFLYPEPSRLGKWDDM